MTAESTARRGRRRGVGDTREKITASAARLFAEHGFEGTSLRAVARDAGVDAAMVHHYFESKEQLFAHSIKLPIDPEQVFSVLVEVPFELRGEAAVRAVLRLWDGPAQHTLVAFLRGTLGSRARTALMRQFVVQSVLSRLIKDAPGSDAERALRSNLAASQIVGLMVARYVVGLEPLASAPADQVIAMVGPSVQRYLTGELPGLLSSQ
ncbi:TetR family transcriptional regulator [Pseudarthrobacter sp. J1763]|uniref:TetR/AcrR family transcriptional regulator n=1 Tax=Pseudarthrobacter sp. J1763 TaxID=3420445 RepID=UPI003D2C0EC8